MSELVTSHAIGVLNKRLKITAQGDRGAGGMFNVYRIETEGQRGSTDIRFHHGPLIEDQDGKLMKECPIRGWSNEALLAIVEHRLNDAQKGPFPCSENATALVGVAASLHALNARTNQRAIRGVEGRMEK